MHGDRVAEEVLPEFTDDAISHWSIGKLNAKFILPAILVTSDAKERSQGNNGSLRNSSLKALIIWKMKIGKPTIKTLKVEKDC